MEVLTAEQIRVLGCLVEKQATTPEVYPLTMNALLSACNQTSNRIPVVSWSQAEVEPVLASLRQLGLARVVHSPSQRAEKYRHVLDEAWGLTAAELAVLAVLGLRGPQTVSELRIRTERYGDLGDLGGVEGVLHRLKNRYEEAFVTRLERDAGQREDRWAHLLSGEVVDVPDAPAGPLRSGGSAERIAALESQVEALAGALAGLRDEFDAFRDLRQ